MASAASAGKRRGSVLVGSLLVALGVLLLLNAVEAVSFGIWLELLDYWPVLLVLIGVEIILVHWHPLLRVAIISVTLVAVIAAAYYSVPYYAPDEPLHLAYVEPLEDAEKLHLKTEFVGGSLELNSGVPDDQSATGLLAVDFKNHPARVTRENSDGDLKVQLAPPGPYLSYSIVEGDTTRSSKTNFPFGLADWRLTVSPDVEIEIDISSGASDLDLDLRNLNVRRLSIETGAADIRVLLPTNADETDVNIEAGAANIDLIIPQNVAARIDIDAPLRSTSFDPMEFVETDDGYMSPRYHDATSRININIEALFADVSVN